MRVALFDITKEFVLRDQVAALGSLQNLVEPRRRQVARRVMRHVRAQREHVIRLPPFESALLERIAELVDDGHGFSPS